MSEPLKLFPQTFPRGRDLSNFLFKDFKQSTRIKQVRHHLRSHGNFVNQVLINAPVQGEKL